MKLEIFSIHDEKAAQFLPPFSLPTVAMAKRTFADCIADERHAFNRNPADYTLFHVGQFEADTGHIKEETKISLGNGVEYKQPDNQLKLDIPQDNGLDTVTPEQEAALTQLQESTGHGEL